MNGSAFPTRPASQTSEHPERNPAAHAELEHALQRLHVRGEQLHPRLCETVTKPNMRMEPSTFPAVLSKKNSLNSGGLSNIPRHRTRSMISTLAGDSTQKNRPRSSGRFFSPRRVAPRVGSLLSCTFADELQSGNRSAFPVACYQLRTSPVSTCTNFSCG